MTRITVMSQDKNQRRLEESAHDRAMARELAQSPAWEWFKQKCDMKASVLERMLLDVNGKLDVREEDRLRGSADSFRRMPRVVDEVVARYEREKKKQQEKEQ